MDASAEFGFSALLDWESQAQPRTATASDTASALFEQHRAGVFRYLLSFGLGPDDCEEVTQEVFLALFLHLEANRPDHHLAGWIFRVAHNLGLKRRLAVGRAGPPLDWAALSARAPEPNAEQRLMEKERQKRLWSVVFALPEQERQCLFLRAEGLRYREIAGVLGISLGTISSCLARSLERLHRADRTEASRET